MILPCNTLNLQNSIVNRIYVSLVQGLRNKSTKTKMMKKITMTMTQIGFVQTNACHFYNLDNHLVIANLCGIVKDR